MKKAKIVLWGVITLLGVNLLADSGINTTGTKPVDEGEKVVHQEDTTKGSHEFNNTREYRSVSLSGMEKGLEIKRENINHAPFTCLHYNGVTKKFITIDEQESGESINFNIEKIELKEKDRIFVVNDMNSTKKNRPMGKDVIIEIEIIK